MKNELILLLKDAQVAGKDFKKGTYEQLFDDLYVKHANTMAAIEETFQKGNEDIAILEEYASVFSSFASEEIEKSPKRKRDIAILEYNMAMVTFVIPVIMKRRAEFMEIFADKCVASWNATFPKNKIGKANNSEIQGGFKSNLCYITTAVCDTLAKPDHCYELNLLRDYRDHYLLEDALEGQDLVHKYYDIAPTIVTRINREANAHGIYCELWSEYLEPCVRFIEQDMVIETKELYTKMVNELSIRYLH